ncbi:MAG: dTDP-4-dehydrorhamnose 3,5-epimerase family protein [candidate division Zixibacteria bacterium]|nr:dTDP-4-dehydrorhamnose 3,5-epimerase family protein [candidate division Zixibacteria bacterium]MBU1469561.1 dTDP-4-dehydrorhamnose 3,5-epimerase family protein [candidate division Zixibacteria bacterium]MBU2624107.1 dTDP-4-dehydrorhamnose 3,5-epimerase family protein [candidate division Zixibacteria bacterium]
MIDGVKIKRLRTIPDERGFLMEVLRNDDDMFIRFGQVYITAAYPGVVKAWHYHHEQVDNFTIISGMAKFVLYDRRDDSPTKGDVNEFFIGDRNPMLIQIPCGVCHGFKALGHETAIALNVPDREYDYEAPDEMRIDPHINDIPYDWDHNDG